MKLEHMINVPCGKWLEDTIRLESERYRKNLVSCFNNQNEMEATTMQATYNGFTGELVKLERIKCPPFNGAHIYDISIYDSEKNMTHSFTGVRMEDMEFSGGVVKFG